MIEGLSPTIVPPHSSVIPLINDGDSLGVLVLRMVFFGVDLFMFLQILRAFERLVAYITKGKQKE